MIRCEEREALQAYLQECDIQTQIHYPIPPHLAECYKHMGYVKGAFPITEQYANEVLSLPLYNGMAKEEQDYIIEALNKFYKQRK